MKFGLNDRKNLTGAGLYVKIFQAVSLLPLLYIFTASGYMGLLTKKSVLSVLFEMGFSALPRIEALALSAIYRLTSSEIAVFFAILVIALIFGIITQKYFIKDKKAGKITRIVLLILIATDIILRALPLGFNSDFGTAGFIFGLALRLGFAILIVLDIKNEKKTID